MTNLKRVMITVLLAILAAYCFMLWSVPAYPQGANFPPSGGGGGTPASPTGSIQFNNGGMFGGSSQLAWDNTAKQVLVGVPDSSLDSNLQGLLFEGAIQVRNIADFGSALQFVAQSDGMPGNQAAGLLGYAAGIGNNSSSNTATFTSFAIPGGIGNTVLSSIPLTVNGQTVGPGTLTEYAGITVGGPSVINGATIGVVTGIEINGMGGIATTAGTGLLIRDWGSAALDRAIWVQGGLTELDGVGGGSIFNTPANLYINQDNANCAITITNETEGAAAGACFYVDNAGNTFLTNHDFGSFVEFHNGATGGWAADTVQIEAGAAGYIVADTAGGLIPYSDNLAPLGIASKRWSTLDVAGVATLGSINVGTLSTATNCANAATPAVCGSAASGVVAVPTGVSPTLTINTTAVTASSRIFLAIDESATISMTTCNTTLATLVQPVVTARVAATSFTIQINATLAANPACVSYMIVN